MILKTIKKYKKGNGFRYEISINKKNLEDLNNPKKVNILTNKEYESTQNKIKDSEQTIAKQKLEIVNLKQAFNEKEKEYNQTINDLNREKKEYKPLIESKKNDIQELKEKQKKNDIIISNLTMQIDKTKTNKKKEYQELKENNNYHIKHNEELATENRVLKEKINILKGNEKNLQKSNNKFHESIENITKEHHKQLNENQYQLLKDLDKQHHESIENITKEHQDQLKESYEQFNKDLTKYIIINQFQNTALKQILELGFIDLIRNKHKKIANEQIKEIAKDIDNKDNVIKYVPEEKK